MSKCQHRRYLSNCSIIILGRLKKCIMSGGYKEEERVAVAPPLLLGEQKVNPTREVSIKDIDDWLVSREAGILFGKRGNPR